jgi:hypothetical protein
MVNVLLSVTFGCGVLIALAHVANRLFVAPTYDVVLNLAAFVSSTAASTLLGHVLPACLSALAVVCWLVLARRTWQATPERRLQGHASKSTETSSVTG